MDSDSILSIYSSRTIKKKIQDMKLGGRSSVLYYAAAATTGIAGILHLIFASNIIGFNILNGIFFIISGLAQLFWAIPMIKRWGRIWYLIGIAGTIILIILWAITRMPGNPITGRGGPFNEIGIAIQIFQIAYVVITAIIIVKERKGQQLNK